MHPVHRMTLTSTVDQIPYSGMSTDHYHTPQFGDPIRRNARVLKTARRIPRDDGTFLVSDVTVLLDGNVPVDERDAFEIGDGVRRKVIQVERGVMADSSVHHVRVRLHA